MVQARCLGSLKNAESDVTTSDPVRMRSINLVWDLAIRMQREEIGKIEEGGNGEGTTGAASESDRSEGVTRKRGV